MTRTATTGPQPTGFTVDITRPRKQCLVCGGEDLVRRRLTHHRDEGLVCRVQRCRSCGFVRILRPGVDRYSQATSIDELPLSPRAGTLDRPGREFYMGRMAAEIHGGTDLDAFIAGAGRSMDNHHLAGLHGVRNVAIGDIMRLRDDAEFIDVTEPAPRRFDVVVASEVVEHFRRPRDDFDHLFSYLKDDGILVCGTDLNTGRRLRSYRYIFYPDHTSFYSPESLQLIARANAIHLDVRSPLMGAKRYLIFSRSSAVMRRVVRYFARHAYAPSERRHPLRPAHQEAVAAR